MTTTNELRNPPPTSCPLPPVGGSKENTFQSMTICRRVAQVAIRYLRCLLACWGSSFSLCYTLRQLDFRTHLEVT